MTQVGDMVLETTQSTGLGDLILDGVPDLKHQAFSAVFASGDEVYYAISQQGGGFEIGKGTYSNVGGDRVIREVVISSSNANDFVNWTAGRKVVYTTYPASTLADAARSFVALYRQDFPKASPTEGDRAIVGPTPGSVVPNAWDGHANEFAIYVAGAWTFEAQRDRDRAIVLEDLADNVEDPRVLYYSADLGSWVSGNAQRWPAYNLSEGGFNSFLLPQKCAAVTNVYTYDPAATGTTTITLPDGQTGNMEGRVVLIKVDSRNVYPVTYAADGSDTIDGAASITLNPGQGSILFYTPLRWQRVL